MYTELYAGLYGLRLCCSLRDIHHDHTKEGSDRILSPRSIKVAALWPQLLALGLMAVLLARWRPERALVRLFAV